jgi:hypothetical protein
MTMAVADGAPQEAAGAAMGCVFVITPYVLTRALDEAINGRRAR